MKKSILPGLAVILFFLFLGTVYVLSCSKQKADQVKAKERSLIFADRVFLLLQEGRAEMSPLKIGVASFIYFMMDSDKTGTDCLEEATMLARQDSDKKTLLRLADIWEGKTLANNTQWAKEVRKLGTTTDELVPIKEGQIRFKSKADTLK